MSEHLLMPDVPADSPCTVGTVGMDKAISFIAEGREDVACIECRWWLEDVTTHSDNTRWFVHTRPITRQVPNETVLAAFRESFSTMLAEWIKRQNVDTVRKQELAYLYKAVLVDSMRQDYMVPCSGLVIAVFEGVPGVPGEDQPYAGMMSVPYTWKGPGVFHLNAAPTYPVTVLVVPERKIEQST